MARRPFSRWIVVAALLGAMLAAAPVAAEFSPLVVTHDPPPSHVIAAMPAQGQIWNLSCEYAATAAATAYYGKMVSQGTMADDIGFDANPNIGFRGRLAGPWGGVADYGIYPAPILKDLIAHGFRHSYTFRGNPDLLRAAISADNPVVVWIVGTFGSAPRYVEQEGGETYFLVPYEHAVTAYGYDAAEIMLMDPAVGGYRTISWPTFLSAWQQLDGMALVVAP